MYVQPGYRTGVYLFTPLEGFGILVRTRRSHIQVNTTNTSLRSPRVSLCVGHYVV
ncbi:hypothetical protein PGT21_013709 [Puccinia graminis f. sp. tritici]|uniref:Uncharacterized protein n=1 Tax=Puccinia graminis f. sp. tritici TaxID=56615 RepID=A0A5B0RJP5_PUCGR|nr:hypothetical protein PGT21_013709 [Puccinia graminis f. sp. tritici]KAA1125153.1 hypothetical protein PGTUg99_004794 [Puccinia graminis f. sp. tritici]